MKYLKKSHGGGGKLCRQTEGQSDSIIAPSTLFVGVQ